VRIALEWAWSSAYAGCDQSRDILTIGGGGAFKALVDSLGSNWKACYLSISSRRLDFYVV